MTDYKTTCAANRCTQGKVDVFAVIATKYSSYRAAQTSDLELDQLAFETVNQVCIHIHCRMLDQI